MSREEATARARREIDQLQQASQGTIRLLKKRTTAEEHRNQEAYKRATTIAVCEGCMLEAKKKWGEYVAELQELVARDQAAADAGELARRSHEAELGEQRTGTDVTVERVAAALIETVNSQLREARSRVATLTPLAILDDVSEGLEEIDSMIEESNVAALRSGRPEMEGEGPKCFFNACGGWVGFIARARSLVNAVRAEFTTAKEALEGIFAAATKLRGHGDLDRPVDVPEVPGPVPVEEIDLTEGGDQAEEYASEPEEEAAPMAASVGGRLADGARPRKVRNTTPGCLEEEESVEEEETDAVEAKERRRASKKEIEDAL
jgi:hypothetical protein